MTIVSFDVLNPEIEDKRKEEEEIEERKFDESKQVRLQVITIFGEIIDF